MEWFMKLGMFRSEFGMELWMPDLFFVKKMRYLLRFIRRME